MGFSGNKTKFKLDTSATLTESLTLRATVDPYPPSSSSKAVDVPLPINENEATTSDNNVTKKEETLYDLIKLTLLGSELTYAVSLMRELGRKKQLNGDDNEAALQMPLNAAEFQRIISNNPNLTAIFEGHNEDAELQFLAVEHVKKRNASVTNKKESKPDMTKTTRASIKNFQEEMGGAIEDDIIQSSEVVYFNDQDDKGYREQTAMVYGISVDSMERRVNVIFRGSRTPADWAANKNFNGLAIPNPVRELKEFVSDGELPDEVYIHEGFYNYLHKHDGTEIGVFDKLMPVLEKNPGFSLNICGHSLGTFDMGLLLKLCNRSNISPLNLYFHPFT